MTKGEITREIILEKAIELFNVYGYSGTSLADIMQATGLQKGGIYNHFASKEQLAVEAFDHAFQNVGTLMLKSLHGKRDPMERLLGIISFFKDYFESPPVKGGCVLLNTAVEADDAFPLLREHARQAMQQWRDLITRAVSRGITQGQMRPTVDPEEVATLIIATLEGALMLGKLYDEPAHLRRAVDHLLVYVESSVKA